MGRIADGSLPRRQQSHPADGALGHDTSAETTADDRARLELALETGNLFTWEVHLATDRFVASSRTSTLLGTSLLPTTVSEMLGLVHPDDRASLTAEYDQAITGAQRFESEFRIVLPDHADAIWVQAQGVMLDDELSDVARLVGISQNITDRKQRELNAAFLVVLGDVTRPLADPIEIQILATRLLGEHLDADRVIFGDIQPDGTVILGPHYVDTVVKLPDRVRVTDIGPTIVRQLSARRTVVSTDVLDDAGITDEQRSHYEVMSLRAHVSVPLVKEGRLVATLSVHQAQPRHWSTREVALVEETAERTWAAIERARAETKVHESEDRYRTLFETIDEGFCVIEVLFNENGDPVDYRFLEVNPAFENHTGLHGALGKRAREMVPDLESHWFEVYGNVATSGESVRFIQHAEPLGSRWFDVNAFRIGDPDARQVALLFSDITEAREAERALRASEERLRRAIEIDTVGIIFFKPDGSITFANEAFLRMSGYTKDDVANGSLRWNVMSPSDWMPRSERAVNEFITLGRTTPYEKEYRRKDGSRWWVLFAAARMNDEEGVGFVIDITNSKRAEAERDRLAAIVEHSQDAVLGVDLDGIVTDWNPAAEQLYGYSAREIVGRNVEILIPPDRLAERSGVLERLIRGEHFDPVETVRLRKDGTEVEVEIRPSPVLDAAGRVIGVAVVARDATARKRLERAQEDFLGMASHDLRSPVTVISGRAQLMKRRKTFDEASVDIIVEQAKRVERLVDDLQELVRLESGTLELARASVELHELVQQAIDRSLMQAAGRHIEMIGTGEAVIGTWDEHRLGQVFDNLLGNAVKYSPDAGGITVRVERHGAEVAVSVIDQGPGIPAETLPQLFNRFYRADSAGTVSGLGLGLYIARMLVEAHGGSIRAESKLGHGSTFVVSLPMDD
jgi:PAS domain S-box-containing protein